MATTTKTKKAVNLEATVYTQGGKKSGTIKLPETIFGLPWNADLVHQVITGMQANARLSAAHTKDRGEVRGGGKKPWRQKGTGRARHGSIRSPIWRKGGVTHGPRNEKDYSVTIPKKMRMKALATIVAKKHADGKILFLDTFTLPAIRTADARKALDVFGTIDGFSEVASRRNNAALIVLPEKNETLVKSFRNMKNVRVVAAKDMNALDAIAYRYLVLVAPEESTKIIESKLK
jgi:large subunit ribosomal protein L4